MITVESQQVTPHLIVAVLAAVVHRHTGHDQVRLEVQRDGDLLTTLTADLTDDPTLRVLQDRVSQAFQQAMGEPHHPADVRLELAADGSVAAIEVAAERADPHGQKLITEGVTVLLGLAGMELDLPLSRLTLAASDAPAIIRGQASASTSTLHQLVIAHAVSSPQAIAVRGETSMTYAELEARSGAIARQLRDLGIGADDVVGVLMRRSPELVATLLAVLRAGAAYLAVDPDDPSERTSRLLADARTALLVTDPASQALAPDGFRTHCPGADAAGQPIGPLADNVLPDELAYVSYTSGSTGEPKGVAVPHRAVVRLVSDPNWMTIRPDDVFLQLAPVSFDASTLEIWAPLANGAQLAIFPAGPIDLAEVARTLRDRKVTVLWLTAGLFHRMVAAHPDAFAGLRHLIAGGDVIAPDRLRTLLTAHPQLIFTNGYGPTENTTFTTCWTSKAPPVDANSVPIGVPINGTGVVVLDASLRPSPVGVPGEVYVTGEGLAAGYLHRPGATAERFVPCPLGETPGERMYRTGDLARWLPSGNLEFLGRADHQVKIQGYRVEPRAVEAELTADPVVDQAVVVVQANPAGAKRLLAYVTLTGGGLDPAAGVGLRERLGQKLPHYQLPWAILVREELPLNPNGKLDRHALPSATRVPRNVWSEFVPPRNPLELILAETWGSVLGIEPIGVEDDFFDLGGHSLLAVDLIETLRQQLDVELSARTLYLQPTVAELASNLATLLPSPATPEEGTR